MNARVATPLLVVLILAMMVLPLPPVALDVLFTFNIALSMIILLVALYTLRPLDFSVFPTMLLLTALLRLSLNVASTRVVLMAGHTGADAAGRVIEAFGNFVVGGNYAVGIVVFVILVIINFVVITKGAGRIAEVSARFTLDAMPGKQMAIDADLNSGLIGEAEARRRRQEIAQEADFFGSMDGASKFVRGDAIAGILIMVINIVGGLLIGTLQHDLSFGQAAQNYTLLTIGDGLVAQIPALIISTAAGIVVARVGSDRELGDEVVGQVFDRPRVLYTTAGILTALGLIPGMPNMVFLLMGAGIAALARAIEKRPPPAEAASAETEPLDSGEVTWEDVAPVDMLALEVGYRLIPLVDRAQDGELLRRIRALRKKFAGELGFLIPPVHIRDNLQLKPNAYRILLKGVEVASGDIQVGQHLAINPGKVLGPIEGMATTDPSFGLPATWVASENREQAQLLGYTVVDASTVVATHLSNVIQRHASELLGREEVQGLLDHLARTAPKLVEDLVPKTISLGLLRQVLQGLLDEGVPLRDIRSIISIVSETAKPDSTATSLVETVRVGLRRAIVSELAPDSSEIGVLALDPKLEQLLMQAAGNRSGQEEAGLEPGLAEGLLRRAGELAQAREAVGQTPVLLVPAPLRQLLSRFLRRSLPQLRVLSHNEIPDNRTVRIVATLGAQA
ncbi:MAG: flagellar biosynthesis protein FlhA [Rhodocyclaceae bacterium]|nr:flagellar biosynthesis protein FlhA [Rhodocyclaceae bacterium]